jgi:hypothetical protein
LLRFTNACRPRSTAPSQFGPSGRPCFPYHRRRCVQCRAIWRSFLRPSVQQQRDRTCRTTREAGGVRPRSASPWQVVLGADAFEVVSHRGAFRDAFLLVLPGMAAGSTHEELAQEVSGLVGGLHRHNPRPVTTQNGRVVPERPNARRVLLGLPEILRVAFTGMIASAGSTVRSWRPRKRSGPHRCSDPRRFALRES